MAKLLNLPSQTIIDGFKGTIDFYVHCGVACARSWPRSPGHRRAPAVEAQWADFAYASRIWTQMSAELQAFYNHQAESSRWSGRDLATRGYLANLYRYEFTPPP